MKQTSNGVLEDSPPDYLTVLKAYCLAAHAA